ncbi:MAG TPA: hypothetical protein ENK04_08525 [Gammaproteobacteria bacterium]|nr:hypothetical protein [Gammaproteobacteria bacterium]
MTHTEQYLIRGLLLLVLFAGMSKAEGIRDHTRPKHEQGTQVSPSQAMDLTLTLVTTEPQNLQTWVRLAALIDDMGQTLSAELCSPDAMLIQKGQRVHAFPPDSKSSIYSARINQLLWQENCLTFSARLPIKPAQKNRAYVFEVIVPRGRFMAIPKEAILEEGDQQIVYVQHQQGHFIPQPVHTGLKGELYTQVLNGLNMGDRVATFGSFFIDAEYKLKSVKPSSDTSESPHAHHHH